MAYTIENNYTGNGSTVLYSFTFPYLETTDIKVTLDQVANTAWTLASATQVQFNSAPGNNVAIKIYRDTNIDNLQSEFFSGSAVRAQDLNNDFNQTLYVSQETEAAVEGKWNDSTQTLDSTEAFVDSDSYIMTAKAIDDRIVANIAAPALTDGKIWVGNGSNVGAQVTPSGDVTMSNAGAFTIANTSVETGMIANDAINGTKIADDAIDSEHYAADSIDTEHYAPNSVDTTALGADCVTASQIADDAVSTEHYAANSVDTTALGADAVTGAQIADDAINSEHYTDASVDHVHLSNDCIDGDNISDDAVDTEHIADDAVEAAQLASNAVVNASIASGAAIEFTKLENLDSTKILVGNGSNQAAEVSLSGDATIASTGALTIAANSVEIGMIGCEQTTISDSDSHIPTSGAVVDYVAAQLAPIGGLEVIADDESFPNTIPAAGVVISISDAAGLQVNSSGVSTNGDALDNSTITINGFPSELRGGVGSNPDPYVFQSGAGLMVVSTGSSQTYNYHQALIRESDFVQLSDDINDFNNRYRIHNGEPSSNNDDGDLVWDTNADKMKVYDGTASAWKEVTSVGDFKILTLKDQNSGSGPTFNNSNVIFDLKAGGSAASITNAQQLLVSVNGVIQQPNAGTNPSGLDGFVLSASDEITFCGAPQSGDTIFVTQIGSATSAVTPADDSVTNVKIQNGAVSAAKLTSPLDLPDSHKIRFGTGNDLEIYHSGSHSYIDDTGTGDLYIRGDNDLYITNAAGTETKARFNSNGAVYLYYDNTNRINTTSSGVNVAGNMVATGEIGLFSSTTNAHRYIDCGLGDDNSLSIRGCSGGDANHETLAKFTRNGGCELYYDTTKEFETKSGGVKLNGHSECAVNALGNTNSNPTFDFTVANYITMTLTGNVTVQNPTTESVGQSGSIIITQDGTGSRTCAWSSQFKWTGGTAPTLSTAANAVDRIDYLVIAADTIHCVASLDVK